MLEWQRVVKQGFDSPCAYSARISTGTGASIVKEKDIKTRRTFLGTLIEILTPISRPWLQDAWFVKDKFQSRLLGSTFS